MQKTESVESACGRPKRNAESLRIRRQRLLAEESRLRTRFAQIEQDLDGDCGVDTDERYGQLDNTEVLTVVARVTALSIKAIREELERLERE